MAKIQKDVLIFRSINTYPDVHINEKVDLTQDKCAQCKSIVSNEDMLRNKEGIYATYAPGKFCTLSCLQEQMHEPEDALLVSHKMN